MLKKIMKLLGITMIHYRDPESVSVKISEARFQRNLSGIHELLKMCRPGTNMEVRLEDSYGRTLSMTYRLEGGQKDELRLRRRHAA